jgi:ribonuclease R
MEIEREVVDLYRAYFMRDRVGDVFEGTISAVTSFGIFVSVDEPYIEGLVRMMELGDDVFSFEESALRLVGRRSGRTFSLGDTVSVEILSVSVARRRIDFRLHSHRAEAPFKIPRRDRRHEARGHGRKDERKNHGRKQERPAGKPRPPRGRSSSGGKGGRGGGRGGRRRGG